MSWGKEKNPRLAEHFISFRNLFNKFNNTRERILESIYKTTLKLLKKRIFDVKTSIFCRLLRNIKCTSLAVTKSVNC